MLCIVFCFSACQEEMPTTPDVTDGEFVIELYNTDNELLLTKKGNAENLSTSGTYWEIRLMDPQFGQPGGDPLQSFAFLTLIGNSAIRRGQIALDSDHVARFEQRWYSMPTDWGYLSNRGTVDITEFSNLAVKGSFEVTLTVADHANPHPQWGNEIRVKGYFSSLCPYQETGGCQ